MERTIQVLNRMRDEGTFKSYAIGGGIGVLFYIEPLTTFDLDVFVLLADDPSPLVSLSPIYSWLQQHGYTPRGEQVVIEGIPVHFTPIRKRHGAKNPKNYNSTPVLCQDTPGPHRPYRGEEPHGGFICASLLQAPPRGIGSTGNFGSGFIPAYNPLVVEAVREAVEKPYAKATARVLTPEYLMAIMIQTGRPTDRERLLRFLEEAEVSSELLDRILTKHGLKTAFENMRRSWHGD